jgi:hypothetical protein
MSKLREYDVVVLLNDMPEQGLRAGDIGTIVGDYSDSAAEVEFMTREGVTIAVLTLNKDQLRKADQVDLLRHKMTP